jgi:hypothetical protein
MSDYNYEYFAVITFFKKLFGREEQDIALIIMTQPLDKTFGVGENINLGIVNNIKRIIDNMHINLEKKNVEDS